MNRIGLPLAAFVMSALVLLPGVAAADEPNLWVSYHFTAMNNFEDGDYQDALLLAKSAAEESHKRYRTAETHEELGNALTAIGNFEEAERHYNEALRLKKRSLGKGHRFMASSYNNLADLLYIQGEYEYDRVEALYRSALDVLERDQKNIEVCRSLNGMALLHHDAGEHVEAEELLKRALALHEKAERRDDPFTATVLTNLAILYMHLERYDEAEPLLERAKYIQDVRLHADHPDVSLRMHATAALYGKTGRVREAAALAKAADEIREQQFAKGDLY